MRAGRRPVAHSRKRSSYAPPGAAATPGEAVRQWDRLGYPRRALNLHSAALALVGGPLEPRAAVFGGDLLGLLRLGCDLVGREPSFEVVGEQLSSYRPV